MVNDNRLLINYVANGLAELIFTHEFFLFYLQSTDIDTDMLLRKDLVTLDEAVKTSNNAVLLAINAVSVLLSVS